MVMSFVRSITSECLAQIVPIGEGHLHRAASQYVEHYDGERNCPGIRNRLIRRSADSGRASRPIVRWERLGGILR